MKTALIIILMFNLSYAQWEVIKGPKLIPVINTVGYHPDGYFFASTKNKSLFRSSDNGNNWIRLNSISDLVKKFAVGDDNKLYAVTYSGYYVSSDYGNSWTFKNVSGPTGRENFLNISFYPPSNIILTAGNAIVMSTNNGSTWIVKFIAPTGSSFAALERDELNHLYALGFSNGLLFRSTDGGVNWSQINNLPSPSDLKIDNFGNLYVAAYDSLYKSTNKGLNWFSIKPNSSSGYGLHIDNLNRIFRFGLVGAEYTSDGGLTWNNLGVTLENYSLLSVNNNIYIGTTRGLIRTTNFGGNWQNCFTEENLYVNVNDMLLKDNKYYVATNQGFYQSTNFGLTWQQIFDTALVKKIVSDKYGNIYLLGGKNIYRTRNNGISWDTLYMPQRYPPEVPYSPVDISILNPDSLFMSVNYYYNRYFFFKSSNGGLDWDSVGYYRYDIVEIPFVRYLNSSTLIYSRFGSYYIRPSWIEFKELLLTTNGGSSWSIIQNNFFASDVISVNDTLFFGARQIGWHNNPAGIFKSNNFGQTLIQSDIGIINKNIKRLIQSSEYLFCLSNDGIYWSYDFGNRWQRIDKTGIDTLIVNNIHWGENNKLFACTNIGIAIYNSTLSVEELTNTFVFNLNQNYPNPFNLSTKISWQSPVSSWQTLKVYDVLGNEVATLVDEYREAGKYEIEFPVETNYTLSLPSGVYFYQLKVGNYVETKKMILMK